MEEERGVGRQEEGKEEEEERKQEMITVSSGVISMFISFSIVVTYNRDRYQNSILYVLKGIDLLITSQ